MQRILTTIQTACGIALILLATVVADAPERLVRLRRRLHTDEDGASDLVTGVLLVAGLAAAALVVVGIIRGFVISEAQNIPGTGG